MLNQCTQTMNEQAAMIKRLEEFTAKVDRCDYFTDFQPIVQRTKSENDSELDTVIKTSRRYQKKKI